MALETPILFMVFNRLDTTSKVFAAIREAKPKKLYVAADGARPSRPGEIKICEQVRKMATAVDWDCEVKTLFRENNLGCKLAISSAITWFFENEPEGVILEDDCLPHPSFFNYCAELLEYYRNDSRVMHISGVNFQEGKQRGDGSYYFSNCPHIWGWAGWARVWKTYDLSVSTYPEFIKQNKLWDIFGRRRDVAYWSWVLGRIYRKEIDTWDFQYSYCLMRQNGLSVTPNVNLVSNIGFSSDATHTNSSSKAANIPTQGIGKIAHPTFMVPDKEADRFTIDNFLLNPMDIFMRKASRISNRIKKLI